MPSPVALRPDEPDASIEFIGLPLDPPDGRRCRRNVSTPTLVPYLPDPDNATGTGVLIAPGGGFHFLSEDNEGAWVAQRLVERGVAGIVLNYRVAHTPVDPAAFNDLVVDAFADRDLMREAHASYGPPAVEDGILGMRHVRDHAADWGLAPERIGMLGFSAGGLVTARTILEAPADARPAFGGLVYPSMVTDVVVPDPAPPLFLAWASDDGHGSSIVRSAVTVYDAWWTAGASVEAHAYASGGHGFGMAPRGTASDRWFEDFCSWVRARGY
jgi:acetyl esterase/lipase